MAVAFVALLVALGGTASALDGKNSIDNNDVKKNAIDSANIVKNGVTGTDAKESTFGEVPTADNGVQGYAHIDGTAVVDAAPAALNVTSANVSQGSSPGVYCFNGLAFTPRNVLVTGDAVGGNNAQDNFMVASTEDNPACSGVEQASVESRDDDPNANAALQVADFYIVFF
jgi:hypothetical protein